MPPGRQTPERRHSAGRDTRQTSGTGPATFYTYKTESAQSKRRAIVDSGACRSVVGKETLDEALRRLKLESVENSTPEIRFHRFGDSNDEHATLFAILMPFKLRNNSKTPRCDYAEFQIKFDAIEGTLPFVIGLPSLRSMKATLKFNYLSLGLHIRNEYLRVDMEADRNHAYLPFRSNSEQRSHCRVGSTATCYTPSGHIGRGGNSRGMRHRRIGDFSHSKHANGRYSAPSQCPPTLESYSDDRRSKLGDLLVSSLPSDPKRSFAGHHIKKLHLQLRNGTATQMRDVGLRAAPTLARRA